MLETNGDTDDKDLGISPLYREAFSEAALDSLIALPPTHFPKRGLVASMTGICGELRGQVLPTGYPASGVTCVRCKALLAERAAAKTNRKGKR